MKREEFKAWLSDGRRGPLVMGVLNVTPDSFSDGGRFAAVEAAVGHGRDMAAAGAAIIDVGGESTRPGSQRVGAEEQIRRVGPVIERLVREVPDALLSIDTTLAPVARRAVELGASLINDISGATDDPAILDVARDGHTPIVLMHMRGQPATMQVNPTYADVVREVAEHLRARLAAAVAAGVPESAVILDPGIGFGKTLEHNLALLRSLRAFTEIGRPLLLGTSRKGFIGRITDEPEPSRRLFGTAATVAWCVANGASIVRVHDVPEMSKVVAMTRAIVGAGA